MPGSRLDADHPEIGVLIPRRSTGDRASELVTLMNTQGLFPSYLGRGLDAYIAVLKTGLPSVRNNAGGHGEGPADAEVPEYLAAYALHLTASNIVLAVEAFEAKR